MDEKRQTFIQVLAGMSGEGGFKFGANDISRSVSIGVLTIE